MDKNVAAKVEELVEKIRNNGSAKFSNGDFKTLVHAVVSDHDFKAKKFFIKADQIVEEEHCIADAMDKFMDKFLKHVGLASEEERKSIISSFEYSSKDTEFMFDLIEEAMSQYIDTGKGMKLFRNKKLELTLKRKDRTGKYDGQVTFNKTVVNKDMKVIKLQAKAAEAAKTEA